MSDEQPSAALTVAPNEAEQVGAAHPSGRQPVASFTGSGCWPAAATAGPRSSRGRRRHGDGQRPDDPDTVAEAREHPEVFAHKSIGQIADHIEEVVRNPTAGPC